MWKFLEQRSFHMTEEEYMRQLDAVADLLSDWGVADRWGRAGGGGHIVWQRMVVLTCSFVFAACCVGLICFFGQLPTRLTAVCVTPVAIWQGCSHFTA